MMYERFLSPGKIGRLTLKNRCIFPPMGSGYVTEEHPRDVLADYHARRARGGCAMNIVEIASVHITSSAPNIIGIYDDKFLTGLSGLAKAIKDNGGIACIQLWHGGRQTSGKPFGGKPFAPSAITCAMIGEEPHAMTADEAAEIICAFGDAAKRAKEAGFDAVEIHGAHGYLIDSFLNPYTNKREDKYGGSPENRARFGCEVIADVRKKTGHDYTVLFRMSARENVEGGIELDDAIDAAKRYEASGIDALDVSQGCYDAMTYTVPPYFYPHMINAKNAGAIKKSTGVPMVVAGRITSPDIAEHILQKGYADFISLGRPQLADPDFVRKTAEGRAEQIVRCIACNQGCVGRMFAGLGASCIFTPATGNEKKAVVLPAQKKKKVLVVGGGPAGLEAARVAAERGHKVTLFEKTVSLGGQFLQAGRAPHKREFGASAEHMGYRAHKAGVDIKLYTKATPERIRQIEPDVIIIATGSEPSFPDIPGIHNDNVYEGRLVVSGYTFIREQNVAVIGGGLIGLEAMEVLTAQGKAVTVVEMQDEIGKDLEMYIRPYMLEIIKRYGVKILTGAKCIAIGDGYIKAKKNGGEIDLACGAAVIAVGARPNEDVKDMAEALGIEYHIIGDAKCPDKVLPAIWGGNEIARSL
ncbi:MAG: FAD-dependent oxidoreductase [Christensenellales bacterium]